jgi:hypothetical protein
MLEPDRDDELAIRRDLRAFEVQSWPGQRAPLRGGGIDDRDLGASVAVGRGHHPPGHHGATVGRQLERLLVQRPAGFRRQVARDGERRVGIRAGRGRRRDLGDRQPQLLGAEVINAG